MGSLLCIDLIPLATFIKGDTDGFPGGGGKGGAPEWLPALHPKQLGRRLSLLTLLMETALERSG